MGIHFLNKYLLLTSSVPRAVVGSGDPESLILEFGETDDKPVKLAEWEGFGQY